MLDQDLLAKAFGLAILIGVAFGIALVGVIAALCWLIPRIDITWLP